MKQVTFAKRYSHHHADLPRKITDYPAEWSGEVDDDVYAAAKKAGALKPETKPAKAADQPKS